VLSLSLSLSLRYADEITKLVAKNLSQSGREREREREESPEDAELCKGRHERYLSLSFSFLCDFRLISKYCAVVGFFG
jgi:hypothetical protein